tara:strand:- start:3042 stop:3185 length:144 start_codon:yes stop_codon:yes gene_type:complete
MEQGIQVTRRIKRDICNNDVLINCTVDQLNNLMSELVIEFKKIKGID